MFLLYINNSNENFELINLENIYIVRNFKELNNTF